MLDNEIIQRRERALVHGQVIDAMSLEWLIIPWGSECCHGCENYRCGRSVTAHGFCPIQRRPVSPHYYCDQWGQD